MRLILINFTSTFAVESIGQSWEQMLQTKIYYGLVYEVTELAVCSVIVATRFKTQ